MSEREIKFRAWIPRISKMEPVTNLEWFFNDDGGQLEIMDITTRSAQVRDGDMILEQYTGLKDKKRTKEYPEGQEIYEGDIVDVSMSYGGGTLPHRGQIVFDDTFAAFGTKNEAGITLLHNHCLHTLEIIGNIHTPLEKP